MPDLQRTLEKKHRITANMRKAKQSTVPKVQWKWWYLLQFKAVELVGNLEAEIYLYIMIVTRAIIYQIHIHAVFKTSWKSAVRDQVYTWNLGECDQQMALTHRNSHQLSPHQPADVAFPMMLNYLCLLHSLHNPFFTLQFSPINNLNKIILDSALWKTKLF